MSEPTPETHVIVPKDKLDAMKWQIAAAVDLICCEWGYDHKRAYEWLVELGEHMKAKGAMP